MFCIRSDVNVYFTEDQFHASEAELRIPVSVGKNRRIASPLQVQLVPLAVDDIVSELSVEITTEGTCPNGCYCECQINIPPSGMFQ